MPLKTLKLSAEVIPSQEFPLKRALLFAFIGGLILNLMPCVLPVLSLKILAFVEQARLERAKTWQHGAVFTVGVLTSFWVLAGLLIALRLGGQQIGWGFQLQSSKFLIFLAILFFGLGLNLFGFFEMGTSFARFQNLVTGKGGWLGAFLSGVLATVVATPCTAPFMGAALGFALSQQAWIGLLVFTALGFGMAFPYLLLACNPAWVRFVPKPGPWMVTLKQFMGFLLMATVVWLIWVLGLQTGAHTVMGVMIGLLSIAIGGWLYGRWGSPTRTKGMRQWATILALLLLFVGIGTAFAGLRFAATPKRAVLSEAGGGIPWEPFTPERLKALRESGTPVFLDFTAAWCLTCQVNERVALNRSKVVQKMEELGVVGLKADWTSRDEMVTQALASYGRNSIPLYVLYGRDPEQPPVILSEILTTDIVLKALKSIEREARQ